MNKGVSENLKVLLVIESLRGTGEEFLRGVSRYAGEHGPWLFHFGEPGPFYRNSQSETEDHTLSWFPKWTPSGVITCNAEQTKTYTDSGIPTILVADSDDEVNLLPRVILDHEGISRMAAEEFINRGYRHFGYCGFAEYPWSVKRAVSFDTILKERGFDVHHYPQRSEGNNRRWEQERLGLAEWIDGLPKPVGVFACNDDRGRDITEVCRTEDIAVPDEAAVLGVDDDAMVCDYCTPPLSSIRLNAQVAGYQAAALLDQLMRGQKPDTQTVKVRPLNVNTRQSTDVLAIQDPDVKQAMRYIRHNSHNIIQIDDVVAAVAVPKRKLQEKFYETLGRSISDEIKRNYAERISQLLVQTDLSIQQIALRFGYNGLSHIARFFKKQTGYTPTDYRNKYGRSGFNSKKTDDC